MKRISICAVFLCLVRFAAASGLGSPITDLATLAGTVENPNSQGRTFVLSEVVISSTPTEFSDRMAVADSTGHLSITDGMFWPERPFLAGDRIRMSGIIVKQDNGLYNYARATNIVFLAHGNVPDPVEADAASISTGRRLDRLVRTRGRIIDVFHDEIDSRFVFFILASRQGCVYVAISNLFPDGDALFGMLDSVVEVTGLCDQTRPSGSGRLIDILLEIRTPHAIRTITPPPEDPFSAPPLRGRLRDIQTIPESDTFRRKVRGTVLAVWNDSTALVQTESGDISKIGFTRTPIPACGDFIEAVGAPETDLYDLNLSRAIWRAESGKTAVKPCAESVPIKTLFTDKFGKTAINQQFHGRLLKFTGTSPLSPLNRKRASQPRLRRLLASHGLQRTPRHPQRYRNRLHP